jgi:hypothetical protein
MLSLILNNLLILLGMPLLGWTLFTTLLFFWAEPLAACLVRAWFFGFKAGLKPWFWPYVALMQSLSLWLILSQGNSLPLDYLSLLINSELWWFVPLLVLAYALPLRLLSQQMPLVIPEQLPLDLQLNLHPWPVLWQPFLLGIWLISNHFLGSAWWQLLPLVLCKLLAELCLRRYLQRVQAR